MLAFPQEKISHYTTADITIAVTRIKPVSECKKILLVILFYKKYIITIREFPIWTIKCHWTTTFCTIYCVVLIVSIGHASISCTWPNKKVSLVLTKKHNVFRDIIKFTEKLVIIRWTNIWSLMIIIIFYTFWCVLHYYTAWRPSGGDKIRPSPPLPGKSWIFFCHIGGLFATFFSLGGASWCVFWSCPPPPLR